MGARGSSVGIATCYGLDRPGIESLWETRPDRPWVSTQPPIYNGYRVFPEEGGGKAAGEWR
jgi:hypothetical protein